MKKIILIALIIVGFAFTHEIYSQQTPETITSSAGGLTKEAGNFLPFGSFRCFQSGTNKVQFYSTGNDNKYWLITTPVILDSVTYNTPAEFVAKVSSFKRGGGDGSGVTEFIMPSLHDVVGKNAFTTRDFFSTAGSQKRIGFESYGASKAITSENGDATGIIFFDGGKWVSSVQSESQLGVIFEIPGRGSVQSPVDDGDIVNKNYVDIRVPVPPSNGNYILRSANGVTSWAAE